MNITPNPEVYRRAAEIVLKRNEVGLFACKYSCVAISRAMEEMGLISYGLKTPEQLKMLFFYRAQYAAMFRYRTDSVVYLVSSCRWEYSTKGNGTSGHPFWDIGDATDELQQNRAMALLMMAEIVENPNNG